VTTETSLCHLYARSGPFSSSMLRCFGSSNPAHLLTSRARICSRSCSHSVKDMSFSAYDRSASGLFYLTSKDIHYPPPQRSLSTGISCPTIGTRC